MKGHAARVDFFHSFASPYSYLAAAQAYALSSRFAAELRLWPTAIGPRSGGTNHQDTYAIRDCRREAKRIGLAFGPLWQPSAELIQTLALVTEGARRKGIDRNVVLRLGGALWSEASNLGNPGVLTASMSRLGIGEDELGRWIRDSDIAATVASNAIKLRGFGHWQVPTFVYAGEPFHGSDRFRYLEAHLASDGYLTPRGHLCRGRPSVDEHAVVTNRERVAALLWRRPKPRPAQS